jgi:RNA polymerase sigma-70 factor (ECF subfamily)
MNTADYSAEAIHAAAAREFQAHRQFLWGLCYRMTGSAADADDLVQETFVRAIERPPRDLRDGWRGWLARVATNLSIDALRRRQRREYIGPWLPAPIETGSEASPPGYEAASPETSTGHRYDLLESVSVAFLLALERLTPRQRAVLILRDVFGYTVQEAAKALDLTQTNVKVTQHRARQAMQGYDASRRLPTRDRQARTADRLREFLACLENQDAAGVEAMLAGDVRAVSDAAGEFHATRQVMEGRRQVARLMVGLAAKRAPDTRVAFRMLNGLPALVADAAARPGFAPRYTLQLELDAAGRVAAVHLVLASRKLVAVPFDR